jgi:DNA repair protein RadD
MDVITLPDLYEHQVEQKDRVRAALLANRRVILCAPPGGGKTRMSKWVLGAAMNRPVSTGQSGKVLFTVQRRGLVDNATYSFSESPALPFGVVMSGRATSAQDRLQVASIDTLLSWYCEGGTYKTDFTYDLIVFDEAHSHLAKLQTFLTAHDVKRAELGLHPSYVLGLTATPEAKALADVFREIVPGPEIQWLIDNHYLSPFRYFQATQGKLNLLDKQGDEFTKDSVAAAMEGLAGDLVRDWKQHAEGRPTIGFFPRLTHAVEAMGLLRKSGVAAAYVDGETPDEQRRELFKMLASGDVEYLCNVGIVERGTDIPCVSCVQLCTAIGSVVRYKQIVGRGSRVSPGKDCALILDHGGNVKRHGFFEDEVAWTLDRSSRPSKDHEARPTIECPKCKAIYRGGKCRVCGYEPRPAERKEQGLTFNGAELVEVTKSERKKKHQTCEQMMIQALYMAGKTGRTWKQALGMAYRMAENQGTKFRVPRRVTVAGQEYEMLPYGSLESGRRVSQIYPFTVGNYQASLEN